MPSISAHKPAKPVVIDRERMIRYNWQAAFRFEEAFGHTMPQAMAYQVGVRFITFLAWAGMIHAEPNLTIKETQKRIQAYLINGGDIDELAGKLAEALMESGVIGRPKAQVPEDEQEVPEEAGEATEDPLPVSLEMEG